MLLGASAIDTHVYVESQQSTVPTVPLHTYIILTICYVFISVVGVIGNITVIVIIGRYQDIRSTTKKPLEYDVT